MLWCCITVVVTPAAAPDTELHGRLNLPPLDTTHVSGVCLGYYFIVATDPLDFIIIKQIDRKKRLFYVFGYHEIRTDKCLVYEPLGYRSTMCVNYDIIVLTRWRYFPFSPALFAGIVVGKASAIIYINIYIPGMLLRLDTDCYVAGGRRASKGNNGQMLAAADRPPTYFLIAHSYIIYTINNAVCHLRFQKTLRHDRLETSHATSLVFSLTKFSLRKGVHELNRFRTIFFVRLSCKHIFCCWKWLFFFVC